MLVTLDRLTRAIERSLGIDKEKARKYANIVIDIFGFEDRIVDNALDQQDRQLFYVLEEKGIIKAEREEFVLHDGRYWRIHYWTLQKKNIFESVPKKITKEKKAEKYSIYSLLPKNMWARSYS